MLGKRNLSSARVPPARTRVPQGGALPAPNSTRVHAQCIQEQTCTAITVAFEAAIAHLYLENKLRPRVCGAIWRRPQLLQGPLCRTHCMRAYCGFCLQAAVCVRVVLVAGKHHGQYLSGRSTRRRTQQARGVTLQPNGQCMRIGRSHNTACNARTLTRSPAPQGRAKHATILGGNAQLAPACLCIPHAVDPQNTHCCTMKVKHTITNSYTAAVWPVSGGGTVSHTQVPTGRGAPAGCCTVPRSATCTSSGAAGRGPSGLHAPALCTAASTFKGTPVHPRCCMQLQMRYASCIYN